MTTQRIEIPNSALTYEVESTGNYVKIREPRATKGKSKPMQFVDVEVYRTLYVVTVFFMGNELYSQTFVYSGDVIRQAPDPHNEGRVRTGHAVARDEEDAVDLVSMDLRDRLHKALFNPPTCDHGRDR